MILKKIHGNFYIRKKEGIISEASLVKSEAKDE